MWDESDVSRLNPAQVKNHLAARRSAPRRFCRGVSVHRGSDTVGIVGLRPSSVKDGVASQPRPSRPFQSVGVGFGHADPARRSTVLCVNSRKADLQGWHWPAPDPHPVRHRLVRSRVFEWGQRQVSWCQVPASSVRTFGRGRNGSQNAAVSHQLMRHACLTYPASTGGLARQISSRGGLSLATICHHAHGLTPLPPALPFPRSWEGAPKPLDIGSCRQNAMTSFPVRERNRGRRPRRVEVPARMRFAEFTEPTGERLGAGMGSKTEGRHVATNH